MLKKLSNQVSKVCGQSTWEWSFTLGLKVLESFTPLLKGIGEECRKPVGPGIVTAHHIVDRLPDVVVGHFHQTTPEIRVGVQVLAELYIGKSIGQNLLKTCCD